MHFYEPLYLSPKLRLFPGLIKLAVRKGLLPYKFYLIVLSEHLDGQLEIASLHHYICEDISWDRPMESLPILGVAYGAEDAEELLRLIASEVYEATGDCDCLSFFGEFYRRAAGKEAP